MPVDVAPTRYVGIWARANPPSTALSPEPHSTAIDRRRFIVLSRVQRRAMLPAPAASRKMSDACEAQNRGNLLGETAESVVAAALDELPRPGIEADRDAIVEHLVARFDEKEVTLRP